MTLKEKFRPKVMEDFVGHPGIKTAIGNQLIADSRQDIILHGPPGTGKTAMARIIGYFYYGERYESGMMDLNASDENGVDVMRHKVAKRARAKPIEPGKPQIVFLDEADALTPQAQMALRRTMEDYDDNCIFILATNNLNAIIDPIQSRCIASTYFLDRLKPDEVWELMEKTTIKMGVEIDADIMSDISQRANGDARAVLDYIESWHNGSMMLEAPNKLKILMELLMVGGPETYKFLEYIEGKDLSALSQMLMRSGNFTLAKKTTLNRIIADCDYRIQRSHNPDVHLMDVMNRLNEVMVGGDR
ncbi:MAG: AAA family ATPase [Candidatus Omnitrophica bacterium]|nr:AAA family ATPase [Candidatus Omnitrophota bacterium]